jgi:ATPase subunit of ABC transporter with duplicated ATPase domains
MLSLSFVSGPRLLLVQRRLERTDAASLCIFPAVRMCTARENRLAKPLIDLTGIRYTVPLNFAKKLFRGTDLSVRENEFVVIIGENGTGKSTRKSHEF